MLLSGKKPYKITKERIDKLTGIGFMWAGVENKVGSVGVGGRMELPTDHKESSSGHSEEEGNTSSKTSEPSTTTTTTGTLLQV